MIKTQVKAMYFALLALCIISLPLNASTHTLKNDLLKIEAVKIIEEIGQELQQKTGINAYVIATSEHFPERFNLVKYSKNYLSKLTKPYVIFVFAPYATITKKSEMRGRVGIIPSSEAVRVLYDYDAVRDAGIDIVAIKDSNSDEDKFNIGILQAYSELADNIGKTKGIELEKIIPNQLGTMVNILRFFIYFGTLVLLWIFIFRPLWIRIKNGKK